MLGKVTGAALKSRQSACAPLSVCASVCASVCLCAFERNVCRHPCLEGCAHMGLSVFAGCVCLRAECVYGCVDMFEVTTHTHIQVCM